jgi:hypothetical protein
LHPCQAHHTITPNNTQEEKYLIWENYQVTLDNLIADLQKKAGSVHSEATIQPSSCTLNATPADM